MFRLSLSEAPNTGNDVIGSNVVGDEYALIKLTTYMDLTDAKELLKQLKSKGYDAVDYVSKYRIAHRDYGFAIGVYEITHKNVARRDVDYSDIYIYIICHKLGCSEGSLRDIVTRLAYSTHIKSEVIYKHIISKLNGDKFDIEMNEHAVSYADQVFRFRKISPIGFYSY